MSNKVPPAVIEDMVRSISYDVTSSKVQSGGAFDVFFDGEDEGTTNSEESKREVL